MSSDTNCKRNRDDAFKHPDWYRNENLIGVISGIYMVLVLPPGLWELYVVDPSPYLYPEN